MEGKEIRILLVEDNPTEVLLLQETFSDITGADFRIMQVERLQDALSCLEKESSDIVLLDLGLPDSQGIDTFIQLHRHSPDIPVLVLTALDDEAVGMNAVQQGAQDYLVKKQVQAPLLGRSIHYAIERHQLQSELAATKQREQQELRKANDELERRVADRTAKLAAANEELESFSYSVSHDLRAPLRAIGGFSMIIQEDFAEQLDPEIQQLLYKIRSSSQRMDDLIQGLLAFSRLGRQALKLCSVDSRQLVVQVLEDLYAMRDQRRVDIVLGTLPECSADPTLLRQVFVNLIGNALKFTRHCNHARIEIGTRTENDERVWYVQDNGAGFDMKYSAKLFGVFQRLHSAQEYEGTGAGLAIVQRIISRHGGRIWATGRVDQGALFCFTLGPPHDHNAGDTRAP